jgi:hypothetical protein
MKKTILGIGIVLATILWSCSKDENNGDKQLPLTYENINGIWYFKSIITADGTIIDHKNKCAKKRDSIVFKSTFFVNLFTHYSPCSTFKVDASCATLALDSKNRVIENCNSFVNGTASKLTENLMQIDYKTPMNMDYYGGPTNCKGIILTRK